MFAAWEKQNWADYDLFHHFVCFIKLSIIVFENVQVYHHNNMFCLSLGVTKVPRFFYFNTKYTTRVQIHKSVPVLDKFDMNLFGHYDKTLFNFILKIQFFIMYKQNCLFYS